MRGIPRCLVIMRQTERYMRERCPGSLACLSLGTTGTTGTTAAAIGEGVPPPWAYRGKRAPRRACVACGRRCGRRAPRGEGPRGTRHAAVRGGAVRASLWRAPLSGAGFPRAISGAAVRGNARRPAARKSTARGRMRKFVARERMRKPTARWGNCGGGKRRRPTAPA